jgi:hypothetical protein
MIVFFEISGDMSQTEIGLRIKQVLGEPEHQDTTKKPQNTLSQCFTALWPFYFSEFFRYSTVSLSEAVGKA